MDSLIDLNTASVLHFGPYAFHLRQRLILDGDRPLRMGGRALDKCWSSVPGEWSERSN
jgi:hypothetical protein